MARVNGQGWLDKWKRRLDSAQTDITNGVNRVTTAPGQQAAAASQRMLQGVTDAVTSGVWGRRVASVSLQDWQNAMIKKGIPRMATGTAQAQATKASKIDTLLSAVDTAAAAARALPKGGIEQSKARANAFMQTMYDNAPKRKGG